MSIRELLRHSALYYACEANKIDIVKLLLAYKDIYVNQTFEKGTSLLMTACFNNLNGQLKALLDHKEIDVNLPDDNHIVIMIVLSPQLKRSWVTRISM